MQALIDELLRPEQQRAIRSGDYPNPLFLVFDHSAALCGTEPRERQLRCIGASWLNSLQRGVSPLVGDDAARVFEKRNVHSLPIDDPNLAPDVAFIPASVDTQERLMDFTRPYPYPKPGVLLLSLPSYPTDDSAIIAYRNFWMGGGFVFLERTSEGWTIADRSGWVE